MENVKSLRLCGTGMLILLLSAILVFIPLIGFLAPIAGLVLLLIGYNKVSSELGQPKIWGNVLTWFLISLIGGFVVSVLSGVLVYVLLSQMYVDVGNGDFSQGVLKLLENFSGLGSMLLVIGIVILLFYVLFLVSTFFFYKANKMLGEVLGENLFILSSRLIWIGAIFSILVVGIIVSLVGAIMLTVAFFVTEKSSNSLV